MRGIVLAVVAIQIGLALPACAEGPADSSRSIRDALPLFDKNRCEVFRTPAEQLFCGDPELNAISAKLNAAIQDRFNRLANRRLAIAENAGMDQRSQFKLRNFRQAEYFVSGRQTGPGLPLEGNAGKN